MSGEILSNCLKVGSMEKESNIGSQKMVGVVSCKVLCKEVTQNFGLGVRVRLGPDFVLEWHCFTPKESGCR